MRQRETLIAILVILVAAAIAVPGSMQYTRGRAVGRFQGCVGNLKNIDTACFMMVTDCAGHYPVTLAQVTPNFLKVIPTCPAAGTDTYSPSFTSASHPDAYTVFCLGDHHADLGFGRNPLQYTSRDGLDIGENLAQIRARVRRQWMGRSKREVLASLAPEGIEIKREARDEGPWYTGVGPSNLSLAQAIVYRLLFSSEKCVEVGAGYEVDLRK